MFKRRGPNAPQGVQSPGHPFDTHRECLSFPQVPLDAQNKLNGPKTDAFSKVFSLKTPIL